MDYWQPFDVVVAPFPFSDMMVMKRRPAIVISSPEFGKKSDHYVLAMITSAKHSNFMFDTHISDLSAAGLPGPCIIRMKLFTADHSLIVKKIGHLSKVDQTGLCSHIQQLFAGVI